MEGQDGWPVICFDEDAPTMSEATMSHQGSFERHRRHQEHGLFARRPMLQRLERNGLSSFQSCRPVGQSSGPSGFLALRSRLGELCTVRRVIATPSDTHGAPLTEWQMGRFMYGSLSSGWIARIPKRFRCARLFFLLSFILCQLIGRFWDTAFVNFILLLSATPHHAFRAAG